MTAGHDPDLALLLAAVAASGVPGRTDERLRDAPLPSGRFAALVSAAEVEHSVGHLHRAAERGLLPLTDAQADLLRARHRRAALHATFVDRTLLHAVPVLAASGGWAVMKGVAAARQDYDDASVRLYADADVLVAGEDLPAVIDGLADLGFRRAEPERHRGFDRHHAKDVPLHDPGGVVLDLHRTIATGPVGVWLDVGALLDDVGPMPLGGEVVPVLGPAARYLNACTHALRRPPVRLWILRDIVQMAAGGLDLGAALALAARARATVLVAWATRLAHRTLPVGPTPAAEWAESYVPSAGERRLLRTYVGAGDATPGLVLATARALGPPEGLRYLRAVLVPDRAFVRVRGGSQLRWVGQAVRRGLGRVGEGG